MGDGYGDSIYMSPLYHLVPYFNVHMAVSFIFDQFRQVAEHTLPEAYLWHYWPRLAAKMEYKGCGLWYHDDYGYLDKDGIPPREK